MVMKVINTVSGAAQIEKGGVLTIGNFDGVHTGHQEILSEGGKIAVRNRTKLAVMTFEPHPVAVLHPQRAPGVLTPLTLKEHLLAKNGVDVLVVLQDSRELLNLSPREFVDRFLMRSICPGVVVEGEDFNFGSGRTGDVKKLRELGVGHGFDVVVVPAKEAVLSTGQNIRVSSTIIRYMVESGHMAEVTAALGRPYGLIGKIITGRGRGKKLGFPTLNMARPSQVIPAEGVYAGYVAVGESEQGACASPQRLPGVFSIGQASTFGNEQPLLIEAHLLGEKAGDWAGRWMQMDFVQRLRSQHRFKSEKQLSARIGQDCQAAGKILSSGAGPL